MKISIKAIRDSDGSPLGETFSDITDKEATRKAISDLLDRIFADAKNPLIPAFKLFDR